MSRKLKRLFCLALYALGITPFLFRRIFKSPDRALVLLYHNIRVPESAFDPAVPPVEFEKQMQFVKQYFDVITAKELLHRIKNGRTSQKPPAVISFDDGYRNNLDAAYPILKKYNLPAIIFVATESIGTGEPIWTSRVDRIFRHAGSGTVKLENLPGKRSFDLGDREQRLKVSYQIKKEMKDVPDAQRQVILQELEKKIGAAAGGSEEVSEMLTWDDVRTLLQDPFMEIGSHTVSHRMLQQLSADEIWKELTESKAKIEEETGSKIDFLSYPGNGYNTTVLELAQAAGYEAAFAVDHGLTDFSQDLFALKRLHVQDEPLYVLLAEITRVLPAIRAWAARLKPRRSSKK